MSAGLVVIDCFSRLLNKGIHVRKRRFKSVKPGVLFGEIVPFTQDFQPLQLRGPALLGAPGIASPLSGHAIRASGIAAALDISAQSFACACGVFGGQGVPAQGTGLAG